MRTGQPEPLGWEQGPEPHVGSGSTAGPQQLSCWRLKFREIKVSSSLLSHESPCPEAVKKWLFLVSCKKRLILFEADENGAVIWKGWSSSWFRKHIFNIHEHRKCRQAESCWSDSGVWRLQAEVVHMSYNSSCTSHHDVSGGKKITGKKHFVPQKEILWAVAMLPLGSSWVPEQCKQHRKAGEGLRVTTSTKIPTTRKTPRS